MQISPHFRKEEFACSCGCSNQPDVPPRLLEILEDIREHFLGKAVVINSGYRCYSYNKLVGGSSASQHLVGKAVDIIVGSTPANEVQEYVLEKYPNELGIGSYSSFTHIDVREGKARW